VIPASSRPWRAADLAAALGASYRGPEGVVVVRAADLEGAGPDDLAALYDLKYAGRARGSRAGALIVPDAAAGELPGRALLVVGAPKAAFARAIALLHPQVRPAPGVHPTAVVGHEVALGAEVSIGPHAVIGDRCRLGDRVLVGAGSVLLDEVELGDDVTLHPRVVIYPRTVIGARTTLLAGAVVGAPGFGHAFDEAGRALRVPHLGRTVIGEDCEVGANATIDRATFGETRLGDRARLDNLVQIAHNVEVGPDSMLAAQSGVAGSSRLGRGVLMGGQSGVADHRVVGDRTIVAAKTAVLSDLEGGQVVAGIPALPMKRWRRMVAIQARLPELWRRVMGGAGPTEGDRE
jgi:UDP-3-O-[3-hydroxymyristoyl] glucosamine N-acyltransferase